MCVSSSGSGPFPEPEWNPAASWLWLPIAVVATGYLTVMLAAWSIGEIRNVGPGDPRVPWVAGIGLMPVVAFVAVYKWLLAGWRHRGGRTLVAATLTAPVALAALGLMVLLDAGM